MKNLTKVLIFCFGFGLIQLHAQAYLELIQNPTENTTLDEIQNLAEDYFENRDRGRGSGYKQYKRWEYFMERMVNEDRRILNYSQLNWQAFNANIEAHTNQRASTNWTPLGPTSYTNGPSGYNGGLGRVNVIAFHPTNASIIYLGTPAGGLWRTTDGGSTWTPLTDTLASIGVSGIAVDHGNPNTIYILTGDGDGADTWSIGVMKSTDGGATWANTGLSWNVTNFVRGFKLIMHPTNSSIMMAVTNAGIYRTTDGWTSWSNVQSGDFRDIEFKPGSPATVYAATTNTLYRSTNTGASWSTSGTGLPSGENRVALAVSPASPNTLYYLAGPGGASGGGTYNGMYRSTDSGVSFSTQSTTPNILGSDINGNGSSDQSWYDLAMAVDPQNANTTITGGVNVWRSTNGGVTNSLIAHWWSPAGTPYVHADIHELTYNPLNNALYCGSDGGISVSTNNGQTWTNIWNGLQIAQFYRIAGVEANQNLLLGGTQDNGSNKYTGTPNIEHILGGDGMDCMIDYNNNNNMFYSFQLGGLQRSTNGGMTSTGIKPGGSVGAWVTPYAMHPTNPNIIYGGYDDVYVSTNQGSTWSNVGSDGRGALAIGVNDPSRYYAANGSALQTSSNSGGSWTTISGPWGGLTVTFIAVDPANASRVWVTVGGYSSGNKVFESMNAGSSWTNISSGLPNVPALCIAYENTGGTPMDAIYVGTSIGVYYRSDSTAWTLHNTGLPNVPVFDLEINHTNSKIRAGTYGRGLWETSLFGVVCDIVSTGATATPPSCPGGTDGTLTVTATCTSCTNITYTITPTAPPGAPISQVGNGVFLNLPANSYNVMVEDTGDSSCNDTWTSNPVVVPAGTDTIAPAISCPPNPVVECGDDTSPTGTGTATTSDNCDPSPVLTFSDTSVAACGNTETITRTWTSTDASGNQSTCTQTITVVDTTPPTGSCPSDIITNTDPGVCTATINYPAPTGNDGCGSVTITQTAGLASGSAFPIGVTVNTFDITDECGNTTSCSFDILVQDNEDPVVTCPPDQTVSPDPGDLFYVVPDYFGTGQASVTDNCTSPVTITTQDPAPGSNIPDGVYTVTLTGEDDDGNIGTCTFELTVQTILGTSDQDGIESLELMLNPVSETLIVSNPNRIPLEEINIYDLTGKLVLHHSPVDQTDPIEIDVSGVASGTYFCIFTGTEGIKVARIIKD